MKYLKLNMTDEQFIDRLKKSIERNRPFSFTRFGDGEIYYINNNMPAKVVDRYIRTIYGYDDVEKGRLDILNVINKALGETDIIGLMGANNSISKNIHYSKRLWSINSEYVNFLREGRELLVADNMVVRSQQLGNIYNFKDIIMGRGVAIISPHVGLHKKNNIQKLLDVKMSFIETPMGMTLKDRARILLKFDKIKEPISIYGCANMGKDFAVHLKDRGKIALDFGATLDAWAGLMTKRWFLPGRPQNHCVI